MPSHPVLRRPVTPEPDLELSVIVPVYNEADIMEAVLREWISQLPVQTDSFEIVVVNDGSTDGTGRILDRLRREFPCLRVFHQLNAGRDPAIRRGIGIARGRYILLVEGNGRYEPADFEKLWGKRLSGAMVLGARVPRLSGVVESLFLWARRKILKSFFKLENADPSTPFRLVARRFLFDVLDRLPTEGEELGLSMTVLLHQENPANVLETTVRYQLVGLPTRRRGTFALIVRAARETSELVRLGFGRLRLPAALPQATDTPT